MKHIILLICLVALFQPVFSHEKQKDSTNIGYYVYVQKCGKIAELKTESIDHVYLFVNLYYPDFCADFFTILQKSPYYRENCYRREIYVEKMKITKNGKYKRIKNFKNYTK